MDIKKRHGLISVKRGENDPRDLRRIKKQSFYWYRDAIASHGDTL
jgi:6-phospho-beta-glucosidase